MEPESGHDTRSVQSGVVGGLNGSQGQAKRIRGIPPTGYGAGGGGVVMIDQEGGRVVSGSEWTDEDAY